MLENMKQFEIKKESLITVYGGTLIVNPENEDTGGGGGGQGGNLTGGGGDGQGGN